MTPVIPRTEPCACVDDAPHFPVLPTAPLALQNAIVTELWRSGIRPPFRTAWEAAGCTITLSVTLAGQPEPEGPSTRTEAECERLTFEVLKEAGQPLIWKEVLSAMRTRGWRHGDELLRRTLGRLTRTGRLINRRDRMGYSLPADLRQAPAEGAS